MRKLPAKFNHYRLLISSTGLLVLCLALYKVPWQQSLRSLPVLTVFFVLIFLAEIWPIRSPISPSEFAMTTPIVVSAFLSQGPSLTIIVAFLGVFCADVWLQRNTYRGAIVRNIAMTTMNTCIYVVSVALASVAFLACGGKTLVSGSSSLTLLGTVLPLLVWVIVWTTSNMMLFTIGISLGEQQPWIIHARQSLMWYLPNYIIIAPAGILFADLYGHQGIIRILLLIIPFVVGRQAMNQHALQLDTYRETITTLGSYMQFYHAYTRGHLERVSKLADEVAREMALPPQSLMYIREAGILHDIGKVGVNEEVLDKVGKLTDEEWNMIKQHPSRGADILSQMKHLEPIIPWVRAHHERPDGRGYPDQLVAGQIPIEAAVISVADAFDAMTGTDEDSVRVYRKPLTVDQALDQVRQGVGTQFDPAVAKAFLRVMARKEAAGGR